MSRDEFEACRVHVEVDPSRIVDLLPWLQPAEPNTAWRSYVSDAAASGDDIDRLFYELALTISQFGGFVAFGPDGSLETWKHDGSGVKALLATMAAIRSDRKLPGIEVEQNVQRELAPYFIDAAFARRRLAIIEELAMPRGRSILRTVLRGARTADGGFCFNIMHMTGLALTLPLSFGGDAPFYKKASLLLMTMEIALGQLGHRVTALTPPPADYRIPQILEGLGILRFTSRLREKIDAGHVFRLDDPEVRAIRAMTVAAVARIKNSLQTSHGVPMTMSELDGSLYKLSREQRLMTNARMRPHMLVATIAF